MHQSLASATAVAATEVATMVKKYCSKLFYESAKAVFINFHLSFSKNCRCHISKLSNVQNALVVIFALLDAWLKFAHESSIKNAAWQARSANTYSSTST